MVKFSASLFLLMLLLMFPQIASAAGQPPLVIGNSFSSHNLDGHLWYHADSLGSLDAAEVYKYWEKGMGVALRGEIPNLSDANNVHWVGFKVSNVSTNDLRTILRIGFSMIDDVSYYVFENDSLVTSQSGLSYRTPNLKRPIPSPVFAYPINLKAGQNNTVLIRLVKNEGILVLLINLFGEKDFLNDVELDNLKHGTAFGLLVLASCLGFFLFFLSRQKLYFLYALYIFSILGFILSDQGYLSQYLAPRKALFSGSASWAFFVMLSIVAHTIFSLIFLKISFKDYRILVVASWCLNVVSASLCLYLTAGFPLTDFVYRFTLVVTLVYVLLVLVFLVLGLIRRIPEAWLYLLAVGPFFFTIIFKCLALFDVLADNWLIVNFLYYSPVVEVMVLLFGLAYNFWRNEKLKTRMAIDLARTKEENTLNTTLVQEAERKRIARDLHDDLGNTIAAIYVQLSRPDPNLEKIKADVGQAAVSVRNIAHDLMPADFENARLSELIRESVGKFKMNSKIHWEYIVAGKEVALSKAKSLLLYRAGVELMGNANRHSEASEVIVELVFRDDQIALIVQDNGKGFGTADVGTGDGIGLSSVRARVFQLNGRFEISGSSNGVMAVVEVPLQ